MLLGNAIDHFDIGENLAKMDVPILPRLCGRTVLRQMVESDLAHFQAYRTDPAVARYQDWESMTEQQALAFIRAQTVVDCLRRGQWSQIGIAEKTHDRLIGDIGIHVDDEEQEAEIGFSLHLMLALGMQQSAVQETEFRGEACTELTFVMKRTENSPVLGNRTGAPDCA